MIVEEDVDIVVRSGLEDLATSRSITSENLVPVVSSDGGAAIVNLVLAWVNVRVVLEVPEDLSLEWVELASSDIVVVHEDDVVLWDSALLEEVVLIKAVRGVAVVVPAAGARVDHGPLVAGCQGTEKCQHLSEVKRFVILRKSIGLSGNYLFQT